MFEDRFREVVLGPAQRDATLIRAFPTPCNRAQGPFNDETSVMCYCLCYQHTHFESLGRILSSGVLDNVRSPLILDVGAGPGTVPVAIAERHVSQLRREPLALRYIDLERSTEMRQVAAAFLADAALFQLVQHHSVTTIDELVAAAPTVMELAAASDAIIVALSYVLKQNTVDASFAESIAAITVALKRAVTAPTYLLVQDQSGPPFDRYDAFFESVYSHGYFVEGYEERITQAHRQMTLDGTIPIQDPRTTGNVVYRLGRVMPRVA